MPKLIVPYNNANAKTKELLTMYNNTNVKVKKLYESNGTAWVKIFQGNSISISSVAEHAINGTGAGHTSYNISNGIGTFSVIGSIRQYYSPADGYVLTDTCYLSINCVFEQPIVIGNSTQIVAKFSISGGGVTGSPTCYSAVTTSIISSQYIDIAQYGDSHWGIGQTTVSASSGLSSQTISGFTIDIYNYNSDNTEIFTLKSGDFTVDGIPLIF